MVCMRWIAAVFVLFFSQQGWTEVLFEGYSKVLLGGTHVGYIISRYEFDGKSQTFTGSYLLKTSTLGGGVTESLKAKATSSLKPISYSYTELVGDRARTIDGEVKKDTLHLTITEGGKATKKSLPLPKGAFFSQFLVYVMLQGKEGIKSGVSYSYKAVAEEDGGIYQGDATIKAEESFEGVKGFKVLNRFKGTQFISYVTHKGEVLHTKSPAQGLETRLVATQAEAVGGVTFSSNLVAQLFGQVPQGRDNPMSRKSGLAPVDEITEAPKPTVPGAASDKKKQILITTPTPNPETIKKEGVPPGKGMIIKPVPKAEEQ